MKIIAVDDERLALDNLLVLLKETLPNADTAGFQKPVEALAYLREKPADIAFLDIEMAGMNGITLAKKCKHVCPDINIIFVTGYDQYTMEALRLHASGYLITPVRAKDLLDELENLRHPLPAAPARRVRIQTFGNFEIFIDHKPLILPRTKCRECLAYLVDRRGALIGTPELAAVLWEDRPYDRAVQNNAHRVLSDLMKALKAVGAGNIVIKTRGGIAIDADQVDCDYFGFLKGDVSQINAFHGEYMTNYSWAEFTLGELVKAKASQ